MVPSCRSMTVEALGRKSDCGTNIRLHCVQFAIAFELARSARRMRRELHFLRRRSTQAFRRLDASQRGLP